jgi:hypothetical protein
MRREPCARASHQLGDLLQSGGRDAALAGGVLESEIPVDLAEHLFESLEGLRLATMLAGQVLQPVPPPAHELAVVETVLNDVPSDGQADRRLRTRVGGQPVVGVSGGVGEARVHNDQLGAALLGFHNALGMRVEVVAGLEMGADQ